MSSLMPEDAIIARNNQNKSSPDGACGRTSPTIGIDMASANALINEALAKFKNVEENNSCPDDSKLLANPKGIIKSYLNQAEAADPVKFDAYRKLCMAHIKEFHNYQKGTNSTCLVCNEVFQHWNTLQRHLQTHVDFRPFSCEICSRTFYSQSKLKRHAVIHNDVKPYKCPVCDRRLGRTEHLKRHLLVHSDNKPYGCSGCAHTTKRLDGIRRHIKRKHGSGAEIISLMSKEIEPQLFERFTNMLEPTDSREASVTKTEPKINQKMKPEATSETNSNDNFPTEFKDTLDCIASSHFTRENEGFGTPSGSNHVEDPNTLNDCQHTSSENPEVLSADNEKETIQTIQQPNQQNTTQQDHKHFPDGKIEPTNKEDVKFPAWEHRPLMLPSQLFYQSLSETHLGKSGQNQSSEAINHGGEPCFNKSVAFQTSTQANALYNNPTAFPQVNSNAPSRYSSSADTFGMSTRNPTNTLLPPSCSAPNSGSYNQVDVPSVGSLSTEMMISQYFQSHQRFAPHMWGFAANPTYPNY